MLRLCGSFNYKLYVFCFFLDTKSASACKHTCERTFLSALYLLHFFSVPLNCWCFFAFVSCALTFFFSIFFLLLSILTLSLCSVLLCSSRSPPCRLLCPFFFSLLLSLQVSWSLMTSQRFLPASIMSTLPVMETRSPPSQPMPSMTTVILVTTQTRTHLQSDFHNFYVYVSLLFVNQWVESIFCM